MDILAALRKEEAKFERQANTAQQQLQTVRAAMKILKRGATSSSNGHVPGKRTMSPGVRAKLSKKAKERWAKIKAAKGGAQKSK